MRKGVPQRSPTPGFWRSPNRTDQAPVANLVQALLAQDEAAVHVLCDEYAKRSGSRVAVFADLLQAAMQEIAELWYQGSVGGTQETAAASMVASAVERLPPTPAISVPTGSHCLLVLQPGEGHSLGLRMLALALEDEGWVADRVSGPDWPWCLDAVRSRPLPRFVGISVGHLRSRNGLSAAIRALAALRLPVLVGGSAFNRSPELWRQVGATAYGPDARVGIVLARRFASSRARGRPSLDSSALAVRR